MRMATPGGRERLVFALIEKGGIMSEVTNPTTPTNGNVTPAVGMKSAAAARLSALSEHPKVQQAIGFAKSHPLGAVATVAAAAALVELQFAVGILTGLGATALLARKSGPEAREQVIARGKKAIAQARIAIANRKNSAASPSPISHPSAVPGEAAPPPPS
jgi:hypothetical protein